MMDNKKCCANCEYWYVYDECEFEKHGFCAEGECRRYPPNVPVFDNVVKNRKNETAYKIKELFLFLVKGTVRMNNPFVFAGEWCGEFKLMKNPRWIEEIKGDE
jgi:hypothetical protein